MIDEGDRRTASWPAWLLAVLVLVVGLVTGNLTGLGVGRLPLVYDTIALPRLVVTLVLASAAWCAWFFSALKAGGRIRVTPEWGVLGALFAWAAVSAAASPHRALAVLGQSERLEGLVTLCAYGLLYGIGLQAVRGTTDIRRIAAGVGVGSVAASLFGLAQYVGLDRSSYVVEGYAFDLRRAFAGFGNPDFLAGLLVLALPIVVGLALTARDRAGRLGWGIGAAVIGAATFATFARSAWLVAVLVVLMLVLALRRRSSVSGSSLKSVVVPIAVALAVVIAASLSATGETNVVGRALDVLNPAGSMVERIRLIGVAGSATASRPLTGYGPDVFVPAFREHRTANFSPDATLNNAHSWPIQASATLGLPGAVLLVLAVGLALWRARGFAWRREDRPFDALLLGVLVGCVGFSLYMLLGVAVLGATVPFWVLLGALAAPGSSPRSVPRRVLRVGAAVSGVLTVLAVFAGASLLIADHAYLSSRVAFREGRSAQAKRLAARAVSLNPLSLKYRRGLAEVSMDDVRADIRRTAPASEVRAAFAAADGALDRVLRLDPADYPALAWRAALQASVAVYLDDEPLAREAVTNAEKASRLDRQHVEVRRLARGDTSAAAVREAFGVLPLP